MCVCVCVCVCLADDNREFRRSRRSSQGAHTNASRKVLALPALRYALLLALLVQKIFDAAVKALTQMLAARYSLYSLYWYKSTNTDAEGAATSASPSAGSSTAQPAPLHHILMVRLPPPFCDRGFWAADCAGASCFTHCFATDLLLLYLLLYYCFTCCR
jgi:hypothetical protein